MAAASWAIATALGPLLQTRKIVQFGGSHNVSVAYFAVLLVGFVLWGAYGVTAANAALIVPNVVAAVVAVATIATALRFRKGRTGGS